MAGSCTATRIFPTCTIAMPTTSGGTRTAAADFGGQPTIPMALETTMRRARPLMATVLAAGAVLPAVAQETGFGPSPAARRRPGRGRGRLQPADGARRAGHARAPQGPPQGARRAARRRAPGAHRQAHGRRRAGASSPASSTRWHARSRSSGHGRAGGRRARGGAHPLPYRRQPRRRDRRGRRTSTATA